MSVLSVVGRIIVIVVSVDIWMLSGILRIVRIIVRELRGILISLIHIGIERNVRIALRPEILGLFVSDSKEDERLSNARKNAHHKQSDRCGRCEYSEDSPRCEDAFYRIDYHENQPKNV